MPLPVRDAWEQHSSDRLYLPSDHHKGAGLQVFPALFTRVGTTRAARETLEAAGGIMVDLVTLFADLAEA